VTSLAITVNEEKVTVGKDPLGWRRRVANGRHAPRPLCRGYWEPVCV